MATYESLIKLNGSLGDLIFYNLNGKNIVRKKSGFNKNAFKKSASYEKVRQNSSEFGHCSKIGKIIRQCLDIYIKKSDDALLYQRFAKLMTEIKDLDIISEKGKRSVKNGLEKESGFQLLKKFQFGIIENLENLASVSIGLWDKSLILDKNINSDEIILETLSIDFESYTATNFKQTILVEKQLNEYVFEKHFSDEESLLHFVVLKKEGEIVRMGFA
ncbi:hypothetical protein NZ698_04930 [Chryseobacterium sp. PBS4-4]|uniref:Uncharacterized protein n=1 Tax=Chryseobacterium edaphi TaxID=2976532 RepID=A0ABT2W2T3_9FLAO|nr:hypothetical protein [Chryseobacterium edaphi]MCU7616531.1 hypothetical protein [Chryseobacterium edaphi]